MADPLAFLRDLNAAGSQQQKLLQYITGIQTLVLKEYVVFPETLRAFDAEVHRHEVWLSMLACYVAIENILRASASIGLLDRATLHEAMQEVAQEIVDQATARRVA
jgi:hypothetical protein